MRDLVIRVTETESRRVGARGWEGVGGYLMGTEFPFGTMKSS